MSTLPSLSVHVCRAVSNLSNLRSIILGTDFEAMVRNAGVTTIVFTGIRTEYGIESIARDAVNRDYYSVIISDAVSSNDRESHKTPPSGHPKISKALEIRK